MVSRREFIRVSAAAGAGAMLASRFGAVGRAYAVSLAAGLSDPALQPKFATYVPNALNPGFIYQRRNDKYRVYVGQTVQMTGLIDPAAGTPLPTTVWGYAQPRQAPTWPGRTFVEQKDVPIEVKWDNKLVDPQTGAFLPHLLPVDTSLHWAYSLPGYEQFTIANSGVPIVSHLHGGHTDSPFDGNPEYFFSPDFGVRGPRWVSKKYVYKNDQAAGTLWYHDHALGITRLNVYAGLAGFYILRDGVDTGLPGNSLGLPAGPYELAYAIQDRMFSDTGALFYPALPGDPFWADFITGEGLPDDAVPQPSALAEFFGDHMLVNGKIWPKADVEPRRYRMRLLNGCDSRFLVLQFRAAGPDDTTLANASAPLPFWVIGSDQGLAASPTQVDTLVMGPGERWDVIFDFSDSALWSKRIILSNIGGDAPFGGDYGNALDPADLFPDRQTDRIMAFDVNQPLDPAVPDVADPGFTVYGGNTNAVDNVRKVALFEGTDEYGRLQPLLGTAEPAVDALGNTVNGALAWHQPTTENPALGSTEIWEIFNATMDAHPVHLHLVHFDVLDRQDFTADLVTQPVHQHNGAMGSGYRLENIAKVPGTRTPADPQENAPKDMVTALPGQVTRIKATFDKPGRYVWHCHILSHEDHEMMRVLHVGPGA